MDEREGGGDFFLGGMREGAGEWEGAGRSSIGWEMRAHVVGWERGRRNGRCGIWFWDERDGIGNDGSGIE